MRVLVTVHGRPVQRFLVILEKEDVVREVEELLNNRKREQAIMTAITKGTFKGRVEEDDARKIAVDLILTKHGSYWNLS